MNMTFRLSEGNNGVSRIAEAGKFLVLVKDDFAKLILKTKREYIHEYTQTQHVRSGFLLDVVDRPTRVCRSETRIR